MLVSDISAIGSKLRCIRKRLGLTQADVAEATGLSDRTYADIERGTVNMRMKSFLRICSALHITPDEVLTEKDASTDVHQKELLERLNACNNRDRETALKLLSLYLQSLN